MSIDQSVSQIGVAIILIAGLVALLSPLVGIGFEAGGGGLTGVDDALEPAPSTFTYLADGSGSSRQITVRPSTGTALNVSGDGYADVPDPNASTRDGGFAMAVTVEPDRIDENTYHVYAEGNGTLVVLLADGDWTAYYETDSGDQAVVSAGASGDRQALGVEWRGSSDELALYLGGSEVDTDVADGSTQARSPAFEFDGTVDEFRRWDQPVGDSIHAQYADDPIQPLETDTATHRGMFNDDDPSQLYYANGSLNLTGQTTLTAGVQPPSMVEGDDYEIRFDPVEVRATSGGYLADAPVMFVAGDVGGAFSGVLETLVSVGGSALGLFVVLVFLIAASAIYDELGGGF